MRLLRRIGQLSRLDRLALTLGGLFFLWAAVTGILNGRPMAGESPYFWAPVWLAVGVGLGRWLIRRPVEAVACAAVAVVSWALVSNVATGAWAGSAPLGYANANAALGIQLAALVGLVSLRSTGTLRFVLVLTALGALTMPWLSSSKAGVAVSVLVLMAGIATLIRRPPHHIAALTVGTIGILAAGVIIAYAASIPRLPDSVEAAIDPVRHRLWRDAYALWQHSPAIGSGPGAFARFSPLAADPDTATAHSSLLQVAAETGWIGLGLFVALIAIGLAIAIRTSPHAAVIAAAAWTALAIHSFSDHLLEFPAVTIAAGAVLGSVSTPAGSRSQQVRSGNPPHQPGSGPWVGARLRPLGRLHLLTRPPQPPR